MNKEKQKKIKPLYCIYNDGDFADNFVACNPCLVACNITSLRKAKEILKKDILPRFSEYNKGGFYITEDYETVKDRLESGESMKEIFSKDVNGIFY